MKNSSLKENLLNRYESQIRFYNVTFCITFKCNAECAHCLYECGPQRNEKLSIESIKKSIVDLSKMGINNFTLTGGEPFLFMKEIEEILSFANSLNLESLIGTNGFWGTSYEVALKILKKLYSLGLRKLLLSADRYHQEFVGLERLINIIKAAETIGLKIKITVNMTKKDSESLKIVRILKDFNCVISLKEPRLVGRALKNINEADLFSFNMRFDDLEKMEVPCDQIGFPEITPDGRVWVCCGIPSARFCIDCLEGSPLMLGNIYYESLDKILNTHKDNLILKILKIYGPIKLVEIIIKGCKMDYEFKPKYYRICDLCCDILSSKKYLPSIQNFFDNERSYEILIKKGGENEKVY